MLTRPAVTFWGLEQTMVDADTGILPSVPVAALVSVRSRAAAGAGWRSMYDVRAAHHEEEVLQPGRQAEGHRGGLAGAEAVRRAAGGGVQSHAAASREAAGGLDSGTGAD